MTLILMGLIVFIVAFSYIVLDSDDREDRRIWLTVLTFIWVMFLVLSISSAVEGDVAMKSECERDLPRSQKCVMIFVPENTGETPNE